MRIVNRNPARLILVLLMTGFLYVSANAVNNGSVDSLLRSAGSIQDTAKIDLLLQISSELKTAQSRQSFEYARQALTLSEELQDEFRTGQACRAIANVYTVTAVYDKALDYMLMALTRFENLKDTLELARCYNDLGVIYMSSDDFVKARENYLKALDLNKKMRNYDQIAQNYMNMGSNYVEADSIDKGLSHYMVSLMIADSLHMEKEKILLLNNIGYGYARLGKHEDALKNFYKVLELTGSKPDDYTSSAAMVNIARGYFSLKNYAAALKYATDAFKLAGSKHYNYIYRDAVKILSDIHAAQKNFQSAYYYLNQYRDISDTIMSAERAEQLVKIQTLYELNLKEQENIQLRRENIQNQKRMRNRALIILFYSLLSIGLAVMLYMFNNVKNQQIELNGKLTLQSAELEALNDLKDKFFSFVAHNLRNPFNTIMGFATLMQRAADSNDNEKTKQYSGLIFELSSQVQKVLSNLLEWSRLQRRSFECKPEMVEITSLVKDVLEMNNREAARKDIHLNITGEKNIYVMADRSMITTVLQNLVSNAINFTHVPGKITVNCKVHEKRVEVTVIDNGIGISEEYLERLFSFDFSQTRVGASDSSGSGLGLVICHEMLMKNGGDIHATSKPGKGSRFTFTLPLATPAGEENITDEQRAIRSAGDFADLLLGQDLKISGQALEDFRETVIPAYDEVTKVLSIENLEYFNKAVTETGEKHEITQLVSYGKSLAVLIKSHQIDRIITILPGFREFIQTLPKKQ